MGVLLKTDYRRRNEKWKKVCGISHGSHFYHQYEFGMDKYFPSLFYE